MKNWSIEIINDFSSFCKISEEWDNLHQRNKNLSIYQSHSWIKSWLETFIDEVSLYITIIKDCDSNFVFIAPLVIRKKKFLKLFSIDTIQFIGHDRSDYGDFIYNTIDEDVLNNFITFLINDNPNTILYFENINELGDTYKIFERIKRKKIVFENNESHFLDLKNLDNLKYKKKNTENLRRKLEHQGELKLIDLKSSIEINQYINIFFEQHITKWGVNSLFNYKKNKIFYSKLINNLADKNFLDFKILKQNDTVIAAHFGFIQNKKYYYYKPTYNVRYSKFSPGNILLQSLIESSINNGFKIFDFGTGSEIYKKRFSNNYSINFSYLFLSKNYFILLLVLFHYFMLKIINFLSKKE